MNITKQNFAAILSKESIKKAGKLKTREVDEIEKFQFLSYVDEGNKSFDVSIRFDEKGAILESKCDCENRDLFCNHKIALLMNLTTEKISKKPSIRIRKLTPVETILQNLDPESLKNWLMEILNKNKNLEMAFLNQFTFQKDKYTPQEVREITIKAYKAVVKNKRKLEINEVKRIVDLWIKVHEAIIQQYIDQVTNPETFAAFNAILESLEDIYFSVITQRNRIAKYMEVVILRTIPTINDLRDEKSWDRAVDFFLKLIYRNNNTLRLVYLTFLEHLFEISSLSRKERLAKNLIYYFGQRDAKQQYDISFPTFILKVAMTTGLFTEYQSMLKPISYSNAYNQSLIKGLIISKFYDRAEIICLEQIKNNVRSEFDLPYLELLKIIYTETANGSKLKSVQKTLSFF